MVDFHFKWLHSSHLIALLAHPKNTIVAYRISILSHFL